MSRAMSAFAATQMVNRYAHTVGGRKETWPEVAKRVSSTVFAAVGAATSLVKHAERLIAERKFMPGGRYLAATGRPYHQVQNCLLLRAEDTREGWGSLLDKSMRALMTGAGIGVVYSDLRGAGAPLKRTAGFSSGPLPLMHAVNESGRAAIAGGSRRAAIWAGLHWNHPDIFDFIGMKNWPEYIKAAKREDYNTFAPMDNTNISVILDDAFFAAYDDGDMHARGVYWRVVRQMLETGEPGFSVDVGANAGESLRNACTEITSRDDSDICNLGSINLARIESLNEMSVAVEVATAFLLAGTVYSDVPYAKVADVRAKNRRLGLGLLGVAEFSARHGRYGSANAMAALSPYLRIYEDGSRDAANFWAAVWSLSEPMKVRAIAPTGTIGIVAETTTGIEPVFAKSYKRRYLDGGTWKAQYVVDPTARQMHDQGIDVEDAYDLARDVERRVRFQAFMQTYVDHGISSTVNLPAWGSALNNPDTVTPFGEMLLKYLPKLRGVTAYPDGARGGQPLNPCALSEALAHEGEVIIEAGDVCELRGGGGSCGA